MYQKLAYYYDLLGWRDQAFSSLAVINTLLCRFNFIPDSLCDVACGTGEFIKQFKTMHHLKRVFGVDQSEDMLHVARKKNRRVEFIQEDMRQFELSEKVDLITCLYDSINHLLKREDWEKTFTRIKANLKEGGLFVMDLVPQDALKKWAGNYIRSKKDCTLVRNLKYDAKKNTLTSEITGFIRKKPLEFYSVVRETHIETSFRIGEIKKMLKKSGFRKIYLCDEEGEFYGYLWPHLNQKSRLYFVCR